MQHQNNFCEMAFREENKYIFTLLIMKDREIFLRVVGQRGYYCVNSYEEHQTTLIRYRGGERKGVQLKPFGLGKHITCPYFQFRP